MDVIENTQVQPQNPLPVESIPPKNGYKIAFFVVLGLILVSGLAYAGMILSTPQYAVPKIPPTPTLTQVAQPTTIPASDETANWKTYTSTKYNWSIKYPKEWQVGKDAPDIDSAVTFSNVSSSFGRETVNFTIWDTVDSQGLWKDFPSFLNRRKLNQTITDFIVGQGISAKRIFIPQSQDGPFDIVAFELSGKIYEFNASGSNEFLTQYHQILSTFKFIP